MGAIKTCKGIHELCCIKIQHGFGRFDILYRRMEVTRYRLLDRKFRTPPRGTPP